MRLCQFLFALTLSCAVGCSANDGNYSMLSSRPLTFEDITAEKIASARPTTGESSCLIIILLPLQFCSLNQAIEQALGSADLLTDVNVTYELVDLLPLIRTEKWRVTGKAVRTQK